MTGDSVRQQTPKCCQSRNQGLCASISSCLRLAAEMSLALSGLISGASYISCSCSISSMMRSMSMRLTHLVRSANGSNRSGMCLSCPVGTFASPCASTRNEHPLLLPTGTEYHVDMTRIRPQCRDADSSDRSARSDILLREEPYEEEDDEEDEGDVTHDEGDDDDDEEDGGGYSVRACRLCQW